MPKLKYELPFATMAPEFINQFLSSPQVEKESITCLDLEDLRDAVKNSREKELDGLRQFLAVDETGEKDSPEGKSREQKLEEMAEELDGELDLVDDDLYHRYTAGELKYVIGEVTDNIDLVYAKYKEHADLNLSLNIGFRLKNGMESGLIIEFLSMSETPEFLEDVFFVPMKNYLISDGIIARIYLVYEKEKEAEYARVFDEIVSIMSLKPEIGGGHEHGPDCTHLH
jgi:hypothetical protein